MSDQVSNFNHLIRTFASTRVGAIFCSKILHRLDLFLSRLFRGRMSLTFLLSGLEPIWLTTIGAKTGILRTTPILGVQDGEEIIVAAGNWGRERNPGWYYNVKANPEVGVKLAGEVSMYVARELNGDERVINWEKVVHYFPGAESYGYRAKGRKIPVFILTPKA